MHCAPKSPAPTPLGGLPSTSSTSVVAIAGPTASTTQGAHHRCLELRWWLLPDLPPAPPRGPAIDVFSFGGSRCLTCRQHPTGGLPSMPSPLVVAAAKPAASSPQWAHHRCLQLLWWPLPDLPPAPPGGPPSTSSTSVVATVGPAASTPQGAHHRHLQLWWWSLSNLPPAPPKGPTIDVFNFGGGRCRTCGPHP
jgi:hypothetical protein